jgi:predicted ArsR family transcriptional regulator
MAMRDADHFRGQAAHCLALQRRAKRADVQEALRCLAQDYTAEARAAARWHDGAVPPAARLPAAWPMLAMHRYMAELLRVSCAFWLWL